MPVTTITLGWPGEAPEQVDRLPLEAIVHKEKYRPYSESDINTYYSEKESREDSQQFVSVNKLNTLAQVFT